MSHRPQPGRLRPMEGSRRPPELSASAPSTQPPAAIPAESDPWAVKRSLGRAWGFAALSFGLWTYFWFHNYRKLLDGEMGEGRDDALLHTFGLLVPILNFFIVYWLWRDLDILRRRVGLSEFPAAGYVVGSIFLSPVFYSLVNQKLNEYWDVRSQGYASDAPVTTREKVFIGIGLGFLVLYVGFIILSIVIAVTSGTTSS